MLVPMIRHDRGEYGGSTSGRSAPWGMDFGFSVDLPIELLVEDGDLAPRR